MACFLVLIVTTTTTTNRWWCETKTAESLTPRSTCGCCRRRGRRRREEAVHRTSSGPASVPSPRTRCRTTLSGMLLTATADGGLQSCYFITAPQHLSGRPGCAERYIRTGVGDGEGRGMLTSTSVSHLQARWNYLYLFCPSTIVLTPCSSALSYHNCL